MAVVVVAAAVLQNFVTDARKNGGPGVIVILGPAVEWMIVALGTLEARAQEELGGGLSAGDGVAIGAIVVGGGIDIGAAAGGEHFADELVEGLVFGDRLADPVMEGFDAFFIQGALFETQQVGPFEGPEVGEFGTIEKLVDEAGALIG